MFKMIFDAAGVAACFGVVQVAEVKSKKNADDGRYGTIICIQLDLVCPATFEPATYGFEVLIRSNIEHVEVTKGVKNLPCGSCTR